MAGLLHFIPFYSNPAFHAICVAVGALIIITKLVSLLKFIYASAFRPEHNLLKRYGEESYAFITGASDGIGKAFCFSLAKRGFNIILVARNNDKLKQVEKELKEQYPSVKTKIVLANFADAGKDGFFTGIMSQVTGMDISILINNAGISDRNYLTNLSEEFLKEIITVNCIPTTVLSRHFTERFLARENRSCIINLSSFTANFPMAMTQVYGATKLFSDYFSRSIALEYPNLDIISDRPGFVETKMTLGRRKPFLPVTPEQHTEAVLKNVGHEILTFGHWKHEFLASLTGALPDWMRNRAAARANVRLDGKDKKTK